MRLPEAKQIEPLEKRFKIASFALDFSKVRAFYFNGQYDVDFWYLLGWQIKQLKFQTSIRITYMLGI